MNEFNLTQDQITEVIKVVNDLRIQSMLFDMPIDIETLQLVPKSEIEPEAAWLTRWKEKVNDSDQEHEYGE